jgi:hypothetical protein
MPEINSHLKNPDPMIMNKNQCEAIVRKYLEEKDFQFKTVDTKNGVDLIASKLGWKLFIETRGNQAMKHPADKVFDSTQISIHLAEQIQLLLKIYQKLDNHSILVMANPEIPRIKLQVELVLKALNTLNIVQLWVHKDSTITIKYPEVLNDKMVELGL